MFGLLRRTRTHIAVGLSDEQGLCTENEVDKISPATRTQSMSPTNSRRSSMTSNRISSPSLSLVLGTSSSSSSSVICERFALRNLRQLTRFLLKHTKVLEHFLSSNLAGNHEDISLGASVLHLVLLSKANTTDLIKICTMHEMMHSASSKLAPFRTDSACVLLVAEFWKLALAESMCPLDDALCKVSAMLIDATALEIDEARLGRLQVPESERRGYLQMSAAVLMRASELIIETVIQSIQTTTEKGRSILLDSLGIVYFYVCRLSNSRKEALEIVISLLFLRVVSPRVISYSNQVTDSLEGKRRQEVMRGLVLVGRFVQACANGTFGDREGYLPRLAAFAEAEHSKMVRGLDTITETSDLRMADGLPLRADPRMAEDAMELFHEYLVQNATWLEKLGVSDLEIDELQDIYREN